MNKEKENKNLTDIVKQQYEERQEVALDMFLHPQADEKRDTQ